MLVYVTRIAGTKVYQACYTDDSVMSHVTLKTTNVVYMHSQLMNRRERERERERVRE